MRFLPYAKASPFEDTRRKRLALARKQRLERESLPLFAEQIAAEQPDADTVMAQRSDLWGRQQQANRERQAANWRRARTQLASYSDNVRSTLRALWNEAPYPGTPVYLLDMLHSYDAGRFDLDNPGWRYDGSKMKPIDIDGIVSRARARQRIEDA